MKLRVVLLLLTYAAVSAGILAGLLLQLRHDAMDAGKDIVSAFAQIIAEQTSGTVQDTDQVLKAASKRLTEAFVDGTASVPTIRTEFLALMRDRPFLRAIKVLDPGGRIIFDSDDGTIGTDLSDRDYVLRRQKNPDMGFEFGAPVRSRITGDWAIPATRTWLGSQGEFSGIIVAVGDPMYFHRVWRLGNSAQNIIITLFRRDGVRFMRSPFLESTMGGSGSNVAVRDFSAGQAVGVYQNDSVVDGRRTLFAFRQLDSYPGLIVHVGESVDHILAAWWRIVLVVVAGWIASSAMLAGLATWLAHLWNSRRDTEAHYRLLFDANPFPMVVVDRKGLNFLAVNDTTTEQYGYSRDELLTMTIEDLRLPEDVLPAAMIEHAKNPGRGSATMFPGQRHRRKDGTLIEVEITSRAIEFEGRPAALSLAIDVTERNKTMKELRKSEERYRALVDTLTVGVVETTVDGRIVTANSAWRGMFGFGAAEALGTVDVRTLYEGPEDQITAANLSGAPHSLPEIEGVFRRRDGTTFPVERYSTGVTDADGKIVGMRGIVIDITTRKALEAQLNQAQKMEAVGQLAGGMAHDFNNILMIVLGNVDDLEEDKDLTPRVRERVRQIDTATQRAADLTRSLLAFSHKLPLQPKTTDINELVVATGKLLRRTLGPRIEIHSVLGDDLWPARVDRGQLENALVNLCINARDAMPAGGRLLIETDNVVLDAAHVARNPGAAPGDYAMLSVTDTGTGIPADVLARVFEPFFTTKAVGKGTGLGLSMVHSFVTKSDGHIEIRSEPGTGTSIMLYLPRCAEVPVAEDGRSSDPIPHGVEQILIVDDEDVVRALVVRQLESLGYAVTAARDATAALAAFESSSRYDLLLTDLIMPGPLNGRALADEVVRRRPGTRVLFMSGYAEDTHNGRLDSNTVLLTKPFHKVDLARAVRRALDDQ